MQQTIRWKAPATYRREGTKAPYYFVAILLLVALLIGIVQGDLVGAILFVLMAVMTLIHIRKPVDIVDIEVSPLSVVVGGKTYRTEDITSFWIDYVPESDLKELSLHMKKWTSPYVKIQLGDQDPVQVRAILIELLPEVRHEGTLIHAFVRRLGL
ncbi:MAG: hypothetical protein AAB420_01720 [Patescibacteria group bacterium]